METISAITDTFLFIVGAVVGLIIFSLIIIIFINVIRCLLGPIGSYLAVRWDVRTLSFIAGFLAASGFIISMFLPNVLYLYITFGIMIGENSVYHNTRIAH